MSLAGFKYFIPDDWISLSAHTSSLPNKMIRDPRKARKLLDSMSTSVLTTAKSGLNREMIPILAELSTLESLRSNHTSTTTQQTRCVPEKNFVTFIIGPLQKQVAYIMNNNFKSMCMKYIMESLTQQAVTQAGLQTKTQQSNNQLFGSASLHHDLSNERHYAKYCSDIATMTVN